MTPVYLTFPNAEVAEAVLAATPGLQIANPMPMPVTASAGIDAEGRPVIEPVPGYHVNVLAPDGADLTTLTPWRVFPQTPWAVWAGL